MGNSQKSSLEVDFDDRRSTFSIKSNESRSSRLFSGVVNRFRVSNQASLGSPYSHTHTDRDRIRSHNSSHSSLESQNIKLSASSGAGESLQGSQGSQGSNSSSNSSSSNQRNRRVVSYKDYHAYSTASELHKTSSNRSVSTGASANFSEKSTPVSSTASSTSSTSSASDTAETGSDSLKNARSNSTLRAAFGTDETPSVHPESPEIRVSSSSLSNQRMSRSSYSSSVFSGTGFRVADGQHVWSGRPSSRPESTMTTSRDSSTSNKYTVSAASTSPQTLHTVTTTNSEPRRRVYEVSNDKSLRMSMTSIAGSVGSSSVSIHNSIHQSPSAANPATASINSNLGSGLNEPSLWQTFFAFAANSKHSDALIYGTTRREAWLQYLRTYEKGKESDIIELWVIMALRYILKGQLLFSPGFRNPTDFNTEIAPILDFQGVLKDQWSWQIALDYPNTLVYGYKPILNGLQLNYEENYDGPQNFIPFVSKTTSSLPFEDNFFQAVCARSLWYFLKSHEWDSTLAQIYRILKPGGYIELVVSDFEILNIAPDFIPTWNKLKEGVKRRGLEVKPSEKIVARLKQAGFTDIHKTCLALPKGWGGQVGQVTDLLSMYFCQTMLFSYGNFTSVEKEEIMKVHLNSSVNKQLHSSNYLVLCYAQKPFQN